ncbi:MAG TPA: TIGR03435 family protein [Bryobacteraceae bacterium]
MSLFAQSTDKFEVASVKSIAADSAQRPPRIDRQSFALTGTTFALIADAYGMRPCLRKESSSCALITGEPAWTKKDRFEIQATLPPNFPAFTRFQFADGEAPQLDRMLQVLLKDRFKLVVHRETRGIRVYALTAVKRGSKLRAVAEPENRTTADGTSFKIHGLDEIESVKSENGALISRLGFRYSSMQELAGTFTSFLDRPVLDRTGLGGKFDFALEYENAPDAPTTSDQSNFGRMINAGPSFFTALQEQLGLKLDATRSPVEILVIDHVERPSAN